MTASAIAAAGTIAAILYVMLDSGVVRSEAAPRALSAALLVLALIFGLGTWTASSSGQERRSATLAGLAIGLAGYAILRLLAF